MIDDLPAILDASGTLLWPLIVAVLLVRLFPFLKSVIRSRAFSVKFGEMEVSVQEASDQLRLQVEDLQRKVALLLSGEASVREKVGVPERMGSLDKRKSVLWVDDNPENNAFETARLQRAGVEVVHVKTTDEALDALSRRPSFDLIISDMGRSERGGFHAGAGIELIEAVKAAEFMIPVIIYTSSRSTTRSAEVVSAGGGAITSSPLELFEMLSSYGVDA